MPHPAFMPWRKQPSPWGWGRYVDTPGPPMLENEAESHRSGRRLMSIRASSIGTSSSQKRQSRSTAVTLLGAMRVWRRRWPPRAGGP
jgi:hypothetical protein